MSTLKVDAIRHNSATSDSLVLSNDGSVAIGTCTAKLTSIGGGGLSHRNIIVNGAMTVAQRGSSVSATSGGYTTVDRFLQSVSNLNNNPDVAQASISSGGAYDAGFRKSYKVTNGNNNADSNDQSKIHYKIESQDIACSGWNSVDSNSKVTFSFWVKSSVAQTFVIHIHADDSDKVYAFEYSATTSWTKITHTIPGASGLTFNNDNGVGLNIQWYLYMGTDKTDNSFTYNAWGSHNGSARSRDMTTTWQTTDDATFEITGVQLEVGDTATSFEHRRFGEELLRCQRYFYQSSHWGTSSGTGYAALGINYTGYQTAVGNWIWVNVYWPVVMRAAPTVDTSDQVGNTGNKHSIFTSTGGQRTNNVSNYHTSSYNDHCTVSNYNSQKYGMQVSGVRADAEL